jgi:hypothetical protein
MPAMANNPMPRAAFKILASLVARMHIKTRPHTTHLVVGEATSLAMFKKKTREGEGGNSLIIN